MHSTRRNVIEDINLFKDEKISIDIRASGFTCSIKLSTPEEVLLTLPGDFIDDTSMGVINEDALKPLGDYASQAKQHLSESLGRIGGKQLIVCSSGVMLDQYSSPHEVDKAARLRHATPEQLEGSLEALLSKHKDVIESDLSQVSVVVGIKEIAKKLGHLGSVYGQLCAFISGHAEFTEAKMKDYDIPGTKARFCSDYCTPVALFNEKNELIAIVRLSDMCDGQHFYAADETVKQDSVPLESFPGEDEAERKKNRWEFLLGHLMQKCALPLLQDKKAIFIIAAWKREDMYEACGFQKFPWVSNEHHLGVRFTDRQELLDDIKKEIRLSNPSLSQAPSATQFSPSPSRPVAKVELEQTEEATHRPM